MEQQLILIILEIYILMPLIIRHFLKVFKCQGDYRVMELGLIMEIQ